VAFGLTPLAACLFVQEKSAEALPLIDRAVEINRAAGQKEVASDLALRAYIVKSVDGTAPAFENWADWPLEMQTAVTKHCVGRSQDCASPESLAVAILVLQDLSRWQNEQSPVVDRLNTQMMICNLARAIGDHYARVEAAQRSLELGQEMKEAAVVINCVEGLAMALEDAGKSDEAKQAYESALSEAESAETEEAPELVANVLRNYGLWHSEKEDFERAGDLLKRSVLSAAKAESPDMHGRCLAAYGIFLQHQERPKVALEVLEEAIVKLPVAHADRFCAMSHLFALQQGHPCPCNSDTAQEAASAIVEEIVRRSAPPGLLESIKIGGPEGVQVHLAREPSGDEMEQLSQIVELAMAQLRKGADDAGFPN
jgi:tetratricopeptide (TPR) repeat protein